jgi:hypothetical protein
MGAAIASLRADGQELADSASIHASGFYVRDVAAGSDFIHLGGTATQQGNNVVFQGSDGGYSSRIVLACSWTRPKRWCSISWVEL